MACPLELWISIEFGISQLPDEIERLFDFRDLLFSSDLLISRLVVDFGTSCLFQRVFALGTIFNFVPIVCFSSAITCILEGSR